MWEKGHYITSVDESELMYVNLDEFNVYFNNDYAREKLFMHFPKMDSHQIRDAVLKDDITRKYGFQHKYL